MTKESELNTYHIHPMRAENIRAVAERALKHALMRSADRWNRLGWTITTMRVQVPPLL